MTEAPKERMSGAEFQRRYGSNATPEKTPLLALGNAAPFKLESKADSDDTPISSACDGVYSTTLFLHLKTKGNSRRHWQHDYRAAKRERGTTSNRLTLDRAKLPPFPVTVLFTRYSPGRADKHNLPSMFKAVIDGVADVYEVNDRDERWDFKFEQVKSKRGVHKIEIQIKSQTPTQ